MYVNSAEKIIAAELSFLSFFLDPSSLRLICQRQCCKQKPFPVYALFQFKYIPYGCISQLNKVLKQLIYVRFTAALMRLHATFFLPIYA